ncbi:MAG: glycosyltransferase family 1 protein [Anaerolineales bacterium]|nr:glycosyltransferase family 1 protein [Anaerolineales bacterium]
MRIGLEVTAAVRQSGGIGRYVREMVHALAYVDQINQYSLFYASKYKAARGMLTLPDNFRIRHLPVHDIWLARIWQRIRLPVPVELITGAVDIYHSPDFTLPPTLQGVPTLLTVHDLSFLRDPESASPGLRGYLEIAVKRSVRLATHVLADSQSTKDDLIELYSTPENKITVLYPGVSSDFRPIIDPAKLRQVRKRYKLGEEPFVLSVGTLQPRKNHLTLIKAFELALGDSEYNLVLAGGKGWSYEEVYDLVESRGLQNRVLFPGFVAEEDLSALYSSANIMTLPSLYEGFGLPVLEAMACGLPVIASSVSSLPEVTGNAALLVDPGNVEDMADAMLKLVENADLRKKLRNKGFKRVEQFSWYASAKTLLGVYRNLAEHL